MSDERDIIARTGDTPITRTRLIDDLSRLGVGSGGVTIVHSSLSSIGWVVGGPQTVIEALRETVGCDGTLIMPAHSSDWSDPELWEDPPVPEQWWPVIRKHWPAFDPDVTPSRAMGVIAETFRTMPTTHRSNHPQVSVAAQGPQAREIVRQHPLAFGFGRGSPYGKLYELEGQVLLLGVGYDNCSMLHFAENCVGPPRIPRRCESFTVRGGGDTRRVEVDDLEHNADRFPTIGQSFEKYFTDVASGYVGLADAKLIPIRPLVDFATDWLTQDLPAG